MHAAIGQGEARAMLVKYSFHVGEREATISMEREFWDALRDIAADRDVTLSVLLNEIIAATGGDLNKRRLSSVLRVYVLEQHMPEQVMTMRSPHGRRRRGASSGKSQKRRMPPS
jgi:predicted DNA-binding ribbon-helix-helix protein